MEFSFNTNEVQRRYFQTKVEHRAKGEGEKSNRFSGIAATVGQEYTLYEDSDFVVLEVIERGAFKNVGQFDVRVLKNHDPNFLLGRTASGTAKVAEVDEGLYYEWENDEEISYAKDLAISIRRGDTNQSSFGFIIGEDNERTEQYTREGDKKRVYKRTITGFREVFDASPVTYPANPSTMVEARDMRSALEKIIKPETKEKPNNLEFIRMQIATKEKQMAAIF